MIEKVGKGDIQSDPVPKKSDLRTKQILNRHEGPTESGKSYSLRGLCNNSTAARRGGSLLSAMTHQNEPSSSNTSRRGCQHETPALTRKVKKVRVKRPRCGRNGKQPNILNAQRGGNQGTQGRRQSRMRDDIMFGKGTKPVWRTAVRLADHIREEWRGSQRLWGMGVLATKAGTKASGLFRQGPKNEKEREGF